MNALEEAQILLRSVIDMHDSRVAARLRSLIGDAWCERRFGDFCDSLGSGGIAEAMIEQDLGAWDLAAPWILMEEGGGRVTDFDGRRRLERGGDSLRTDVTYEASWARLSSEPQLATAYVGQEAAKAVVRGSCPSSTAACPHAKVEKIAAPEHRLAESAAAAD